MDATVPLARWQRRGVRTALLGLCLIAVAASVRRLVVLDIGAGAGTSATGGLDAVFAAKAVLTRWHVIAGLIFALAVPVQLSARVRQRAPEVHRWLGRSLAALGVLAALSGEAMVVHPVGGALEVTAIVVFGTLFVVAIVDGWREARRGRFAAHRAWMIRAVSVVLGVAVTRPVIGMFFALGRVTTLQPADFFGPAFWIGFGAAAMAGEWYVRRTSGGRRAEGGRRT